MPDRQDGGVRAADWDERYAQREQWTTGPNPLVESLVGELPPGDAVDLAAGEGRHALWLAARGWRGTAVDFSAVGLQRGREQAAEAGPTRVPRGNAAVPFLAPPPASGRPGPGAFPPPPQPGEDGPLGRA